MLSTVVEVSSATSARVGVKAVFDVQEVVMYGWAAGSAIAHAAGLFVFFFGLVYAFIRKSRVANNRWGAGATTLEWTLSSPPRLHEFEVFPRIQ